VRPTRLQKAIARVAPVAGFTGFSHERGVQGETNVWLTPPHIIRDLGPFDLDPCAAPEPRPWPTATQHFVEADDGLTQPWGEAFVYMNPPYGPNTGAWMDRLADHRNGIALVFARTDTQWFQRIAAHTDAVLFVDGRIAFYLPDGRPGPSRGGAGSCFFGYGDLAVERLASSAIPGFFVRPEARRPRSIQRGLFR
jgi:hypothetical protein